MLKTREGSLGLEHPQNHAHNGVAVEMCKDSTESPTLQLQPEPQTINPAL